MQTENSEWKEIVQLILYSLSLSPLLNEAEIPVKILYLHDDRIKVFFISKALTLKH